jgi:hypothetical protein
MKQFILLAILFSTFSMMMFSSNQDIKNEILKIGTETSKLPDRPEKENINGFLPEKIYIKTLTQTFCKGFEFCLVDGRIYFKTPQNDNWQLFLKTGLPFSKKNKFPSPTRIVEIAADDDCLFAFDNDGKMYHCYLRKTTRETPMRWINVFGWPNKVQLEQNDFVKNKRAWGMAVRRQEILWYEDIFQNQHHYGTMGLETLYFLSENGQEIHFTDSGLPCDFSHSILGPERGSFIAKNISTSGSTIFLINEKGEMFTRLIDFDTVGSDPMFFKYTYKNEKQNYPGYDYRSNFTLWGLPNEDWKKHPQIKLSGKARITSCITIFQNGKGNFAREMRVAGISSDGKIGYYKKQLNDKSWAFVEAPLILDSSQFLDTNSDIKFSYGKKNEFKYCGNLIIDGKEIKNLNFRIPNFVMSEGSCTLEISWQTGKTSLTLHPVEMWTYLVRKNPGLDGTSKKFFVTIEYPLDFFSKIDNPEVKNILQKIFANKNKELFTFVAEATDQFFQMIPNKDYSKNISLFLTKETTGLPIHPEVYKATLLYEQPNVKLFLDESLVLEKDKIYSIQNRSEIQTKLERNIQYQKFLQNELETFRKFKYKTNLSRWGYNIVDLITSITFLNRIDFPKIKTITMFGNEIMTTNANTMESATDAKEWTYAHIIELLNMRILAYQSLIDKFDDNIFYSELPVYLFDSYPEFFNKIGTPNSIQGFSPFYEKNAELIIQSNISFFPGFILGIGDKEDFMLYLVEIKNPTKNIIKLFSENNILYSKEEPLKLPVVFTLLTIEKIDKNFIDINKDVKKIKSNKGTLKWDGETITLIENNLLIKKTIFKTQK